MRMRVTEETENEEQEEAPEAEAKDPIILIMLTVMLEHGLTDPKQLRFPAKGEDKAEGRGQEGAHQTLVPEDQPMRLMEEVLTMTCMMILHLSLI